MKWQKKGKHTYNTTHLCKLLLFLREWQPKHEIGNKKGMDGRKEGWQPGETDRQTCLHAFETRQLSKLRQ